MPPTGTATAQVSYGIRMTDPVVDYLKSLTQTLQNPLYRALYDLQDDPYPKGHFSDRDTPDVVGLVIDTGGAKYQVHYKVLAEKEKIVLMSLYELRY